MTPREMPKAEAPSEDACREASRLADLTGETWVVVRHLDRPGPARRRDRTYKLDSILNYCPLVGPHAIVFVAGPANLAETGR